MYLGQHIAPCFYCKSKEFLYDKQPSTYMKIPSFVNEETFSSQPFAFELSKPLNLSLINSTKVVSSSSGPHVVIVFPSNQMISFS